jgi:hypothetical protein
MAINLDNECGIASGFGTSSTANLNHVKLVAIIISIAYIGTTSPNAVTVGGVAAALITGSKKSYGTNNSIEAWFIWRAAAGNETVSVGIIYWRLEYLRRCKDCKRYRSFTSYDFRDAHSRYGRKIVDKLCRGSQ